MKTIEYIPKVEIIEKESEVNVYLFLPGVKKENIHVEVSDENVISIDASRETKVDKQLIFGKPLDENINYHKALRLSQRLDTNSILPKYENGLLHLLIKAKEKVPPKEIAL